MSNRTRLIESDQCGRLCAKVSNLSTSMDNVDLDTSILMLL